MNIKVLGSGCPKCKMLEKNVEEALKMMDKTATVEKITEIKDIMRYNVMSTPALVVDEKVVLTGKVLPAKKLIDLLK